MPNSESLTINEQYDRALEMFSNTQTMQKHEGLTLQNMKRYKLIMIDLSEVLIYGKVDASLALAHIFKEGLAGPKSDYSYKLFLLVGSKLNNTKCTQKLSTLQDINEAEKEANIWVSFIRNNNKNYNIKIPLEEMAETRKALGKALLDAKISLETVYDCFDIIKGKGDNTYNTENPNFGIPSYNASLPPEKKYEVKHTGQPAKEGCEIS